MRKLRLPFLLFALILSFSVHPARTASAGPCWCEIACWDAGDQICWQDACCNVHCCDKINGWCPNPCWS